MGKPKRTSEATEIVIRSNLLKRKREIEDQADAEAYAAPDEPVDPRMLGLGRPPKKKVKLTPQLIDDHNINWYAVDVTTHGRYYTAIYTSDDQGRPHVESDFVAWRCRLCPKLLNTSGSTGNINAHLKKYHPMALGQDPEAPPGT